MATCSFLLLMLYMSVAEILPHKLVMPSSKGQGLDESFLSKDPDYQDRYTKTSCGTLRGTMNQSSHLKMIDFQIKIV